VKAAQARSGLGRGGGAVSRASRGTRVTVLAQSLPEEPVAKRLGWESAAREVKASHLPETKPETRPGKPGDSTTWWQNRGIATMRCVLGTHLGQRSRSAASSVRPTPAAVGAGLVFPSCSGRRLPSSSSSAVAAHDGAEDIPGLSAQAKAELNTTRVRRGLHCNAAASAPLGDHATVPNHPAPPTTAVFSPNLSPISNASAARPLSSSMAVPQ
jgi:hypothetical protein